MSAHSSGEDAAASGEAGFTLVELLVVMLIIGVLAAIGFAIYDQQREKAWDADTKSNVSGLILAVESCFVREDDYGRCDSASELEQRGLPVDSPGESPSEGMVAVVSTFGKDGWSIEGKSESGTTFTAFKDLSLEPGVVRDCDQHGEGGCPDDGKW